MINIITNIDEIFEIVLKDYEMNLAEHGVRKYDSDLGRFLCPDAMWEK